MAHKYDDNPGNLNPGPGQYKKQTNFDKLRPLSFAKETRDNALIVKEQLTTPAPG